MHSNKYVDISRSGKRTVTFRGEHSHAAPAPSSRLAPEVEIQARNKMKDPFASPVRVEREFLPSLPSEVTPSRQNTPTRKQLRNKKYYQKRKHLLGGDAFENIVQKHVVEKPFVREAGIILSLYFIMAADDAIRLLEQHGHVGGTFNFMYF